MTNDEVKVIQEHTILSIFVCTVENYLATGKKPNSYAVVDDSIISKSQEAIIEMIGELKKNESERG